MEPTPLSNSNSAPTLTLPTSTNDVSNIFATLIQSQQSLTSLINNLKEDVDRMKVRNSTPNPNVRMKFKETCVPKTPASQKKFQRYKSEPPQATSNSQHKSHKPSPNSSSQNITNESPVKQNPLQMQTSDFPPNFQGVKNAVQTAPGEETLVQFYRKFSGKDDITNVVRDSSAPNLVDGDAIITLSRKEIQKCKLGRGIANLSESYVAFICGALARLGITILCPNLIQNQDNLYNVACRIVAFTTLKKISVSGAYDYISLNHFSLMQSSLLQKAYDDFFNYVMKAKFDQEE
ncbi:hypothetical protein O181_092098 [Austropuccinia psidii MF-1]|uniref:Uncharacterized protein n=1 Tax=Austropuccinia psidii MF-1 TaxID=1389203 RepID=A0A9Q3IXW3_9BASI|nr:hypothetical protein [Austropuccinia psidii MF-1]